MTPSPITAEEGTQSSEEQDPKTEAKTESGNEIDDGP